LGDVYEGSLKNNYLYQGAYAELDEDIGWNDFMLRNYDAQIGRWVQQDPFQEFASPYIGIGGDPVNNTDPTGGITYCPGTSWLAIFLDKAIYTLSKTSPALFKLSIAISITKTALIVNNTIRVSGIINRQLSTTGVGDEEYLNPGGDVIYVSTMNPELFDGNIGKVGNLRIQPMKGTVRAFTVTGDDVDNRAVRFVALFSTETGKFVGYSWDKKHSYTYEDFLKEYAENLIEQLEHADDPFWDPNITREQGAKNAINWALFGIVPSPLKTTTGLVNTVKTVNEVNAVKNTSNILLTTARQLQAKFKHAIDFGVKGNYNKVTVAEFSAALNQHINAAGVQIIQGAFRNTKNLVDFYIDVKTGLTVVATRTGEFITGAKLTPSQVNDILTKKFLW
jgi:RHS repeat-associated protein